MEKAKFMVFLRTPVDPQLKEILKGYIAQEAALEFLICSEWDQNGSFVFLKATNFKTDGRWGINIPVSAVLSVADFAEANPVGFTRPQTHTNKVQNSKKEISKTKTQAEEK